MWTETVGGDPSSTGGIELLTMTRDSAQRVKPDQGALAELDSLAVSTRYALNMNSVWLGRYLECFQCEGSSFLLESRDRASGQLTGVLPLEVRRVPAGPGWTFRRLVPLSTGPADFSPILCLAGHEGEFADSVCTWLVSHANQWDALRIDLIPKSSRGWPELVQALQESGFLPSVSEDKYFYKVDTQRPWEIYQADFLRGHLDTLRNLRNRLARECGRPEVVLLAKGIEGHLDGFLACYRQRRKAKGEKDPFIAQPERLPFLLSVVQDFEQQGKARLALLRCGETIVAYQLDWVEDGVWYFYHPAFEASYARYSPGRILLLETLKIAFADAQIREFNFMRGDEEYKTQFADQTEAYVSIRVWNRRSLRLRMTAYYTRLAALWQRIVPGRAATPD